MKDLYIVANWKANKTEKEALSWFEDFKNELPSMQGMFENKEVIVCPSYPTLSKVKSYILENELPLGVGSQDISIFGRGAYTGEVPASLIEPFVRFCIVGHSERRRNFGEDDEILKEKVQNALSSNIMPIFCIQNENTYIPDDVKIVAYEPIEAIGTGNPDTPENAEKVATLVKAKQSGIMHVLYGGSVTEENVNSFCKMQNISGVLVGGASLEAQAFASIIKNA